MKTNLLQNIALFAFVLFISSCSGSGLKCGTPEEAIDALIKSAEGIDSEEAVDDFAAKVVDFDGNPIADNKDLDAKVGNFVYSLDFLAKNGGYDHSVCHSGARYECTKKELCDSLFLYSVLIYAKNGHVDNILTPVLNKGNKYIALPPIFTYIQGGYELKAEELESWAFDCFKNLIDKERAKKIMEEKSAGTELNEALFGKYSNKTDPNVAMTLNKEAKADPDFNNTKTYGSITVANEYFEIENIIYITAIKPDGKKIVADITVTQMEGDPEEGDVSYAVKEKTKMTIVPIEKGVKIKGCNKIPEQILIKE